MYKLSSVFQLPQARSSSPTLLSTSSDKFAPLIALAASIYVYPVLKFNDLGFFSSSVLFNPCWIYRSFILLCYMEKVVIDLNIVNSYVTPEFIGECSTLDCEWYFYNELYISSDTSYW